MATENQIWGISVKGCRLGISIPNERIQAGRAVEATIVFKNDGSKEVQFPRVSIWFEYEYKVIYEDDEDAPLTSYGKQSIRALNSGSLALKTIAPGGEITSEVLINRLYDMSITGLYTLEVFKEIPDPDGTGFIKVVSNRINIETVD